MKDEEKCIDFIIQNSETVLNHKEAKEFLTIYDKNQRV